MAIFQKSVLNKFIKSQDSSKIDIAYQKFSEIFLQADRQAEIRSMKEEEYQDGFLDDLFVNILGYVKRPNTGYNLVREKKNEADSKKADGAILKNDLPLAVIELKGTDTTDLDKVTEQGFGYKNNHKECVYVVTSNFEKLRFFIHNAVEFIEFNLFTLSKEDFTLLWICLHSKNLLDNLPAKIKSESVVKEKDITKSLYKDYSSFKKELWQNIVSLNPNGEPLMFYKKTQKLIDRFLFIFFSEDAGLLPPNSISRMIDRWQMLKDEDAYKPLYDIFKQYFGYINTGRPGKTPQDEIFAYNGGLMLEDDVLESISIDDDILLKHVSKLTAYDFSSEVDVNILGHIFENSLNDIEAVIAELEGNELDKTKTKRKKDGVFYTPKYITKYIVDSTIGKLCNDKKIALKIFDEDFAEVRTRRKKEYLKQLDQQLQQYRNWLLNLTICDPGVGSGAFLNQALEFLIEEHNYIDELESMLLGNGFKFPGVESHILENNIFGVDINDESIEIAKLSLWLRTAQRGRKLTSLNNNIKCGNSLIDDPEIAKEKAFNWQNEFPNVFENGGFDVIIGNPPYGAVEMNNQYGTGDTYMEFYIKSIGLLKTGGVLGFITPDSWQINDNAAPVREAFVHNGILYEVKDCYKVFDDAPDVWCNCVFFKKGCFEGKLIISRDFPYNQDIFQFEHEWNEINSKKRWFLYINKNIESIFTKMEKHEFPKDKIEINRGFSPTPNPINLTDKPSKRQVIGGEDFGRYVQKINPKYLIDSYSKSESSISLVLQKPFIGIQRIRTNSLDFKSRWIIASFFNKGYVPIDSISFLTLKDNDIQLEYILAILNSNLMNFYYKLHYSDKNVKPIYLKELPIPVISSIHQNTFSSIVNTIISENERLKGSSLRLINYIKTTLKQNQVTNKILNWYSLSFKEFIVEINIILKSSSSPSLTKKEEIDWLEVFDELKAQINDIQQNILNLEKEIDLMVYSLYGLSEDEILIVENR